MIMTRVTTAFLLLLLLFFIRTTTTSHTTIRRKRTLSSSSSAEADVVVTPLHRKRGNWRHGRSVLQEQNSYVNNSSYYDGLYQGLGIHYVEVFVGCPPQKQTLIIDTGSDNIGFPCSPDCDPITCGQSYHLHPFFEYSDSNCFSTIPCNDCLTTTHCSLDDGETCSVNIYYAEGSSWSGFEAEDIIAIGSSNEEQFSLRFACQTSLTGLFQTQLADGIVGMNKGQASLWQQLNHTIFSLCYSIVDDTCHPGGVMILGGFDPSLHKTPIVYAQDVRPSSSDFFTVHIRNINLRVGGGVSVVIDSSSAAAGGGFGAVRQTSVNLDRTYTPIVDSGTTCTYLNRRFRTPMAQAWREITDEKFQPFSTDGVSEEDLDRLPTIFFQLEGTTTPQDNPFAPGMVSNSSRDILISFPPERYLTCLFFSESDEGVLGNNFLDGHDVVFDVENARVGFAESDCEFSQMVGTYPSWTPCPGPPSSQGNGNMAASNSATIMSAKSLLAVALGCFLSALLF